jgi:hypothetical protein
MLRIDHQHEPQRADEPGTDSGVYRWYATPWEILRQTPEMAGCGRRGKTKCRYSLAAHEPLEIAEKRDSHIPAAPATTRVER